MDMFTNTNMHPWIGAKIFETIDSFVSSPRWPVDYQQVVFTNGCFDLLHPGHIDYLMRSRDLGEMLIVGLNHDSSVQQLKGPHRPIQPWKDRAVVLAGMACVDLVIGFPEETPINLIKALQPTVTTKGGDYKIDEMIGKEYIESYGGRVAVLPFLEGYSTSGLVK